MTPKSAKEKVAGLPEGFSFHDLRHYLASLLIAGGADIKTVQARMRHASARTTLDTYGHLWPDADESTRSMVGAVISERMNSVGATADPLTTATMSVLVSALAGLHVVVEHVISLTRTMDDLSYPVGTMDG